MTDEAPPGYLEPERLARAAPAPAWRARLRETPEDFVVDEVLGYEPDGEGAHAWLHVRKRDANTAWVAERIAALAGVRARDVGYAGRKDRVAVTSQWFSVPCAGEAPAWQGLEADGVEVLEAVRSRRKLRRGALRGNRFRLRLRGVDAARDAVEDRLRAVGRDGVPNYFGPQRFGRGGGNVARAWRALASPRGPRGPQRGLLLSTARSLLFNRILDRRVACARWNAAVPGDAMMIDGSASVFRAPAVDAALRARVLAGRVHPTGALFGAGDPMVEGEALAIEGEALCGCAGWQERLLATGMRAARRALRVRVADLAWRWLDGGAAPGLEVAFFLPAGAYATAVLREMVATEDAGGEA